jgi:hypothetical protein
MNHQSELPPPQPPDPPGTRPAVNWPLVTAQVMCIQRKLAGERAARTEKEAQGKSTTAS